MEHEDDWKAPSARNEPLVTLTADTDPLRVPVTAGENAEVPARWWRTASDMSSLVSGRPWLEEGSSPAFGQHVSTSPDTWLGVAMLKKAMSGGPAVHAARFAGNLTIPPKRLLETLKEITQVRPIRYGYGRTGADDILLSNDDTMLSFDLQDGNKYATIRLATINEEVFHKVAQLTRGILTHDNPKEGFVYALARGMAGYSLIRVGAAGTPLERDNYDPKVVEAYDHVVTDLKAESPCGRLVILAGIPGGGKTYLMRSLLADIPKGAFVIVPPHLVKELGSPDLLPALTAAKHDGLTGPICLIIEDADQVLVNRTAGDMSAISSLLNLGDGILGSVLDVRILATTNAAKLEMDPATRRPGRLCSYIEVGELEPVQAEKVVTRLTGQTLRPPNKVTLAQAYGKARSLGWKPPPKVPPPSPYQKEWAL